MRSRESLAESAEHPRHTPYAEGVRFHSPGSPRFAAHPGFQTAPAPIRRRRFTRRRIGDLPFVAVCETPSGYLPEHPPITQGAPRSAATLGCGVQPLRGKETGRQCELAHQRNKCRNHNQDSLPEPFTSPHGSCQASRSEGQGERGILPRRSRSSCAIQVEPGRSASGVHAKTNDGGREPMLPRSMGCNPMVEYREQANRRRVSMTTGAIVLILGASIAISVALLCAAEDEPATATEVKPKHEDAQTLFSAWQANARTEGQIPGADREARRGGEVLHLTQ